MFLLSILLVALYLGAAIWRKRELPESISAMVYLLPEGGWRWLWSFWLWIVSLLTTIPVISILDTRNMAYLGFFTLASLVFVGAWPLYRPETRKAHYIGGSAAGILSQVCVLVICPWWLMLWLLFTGVDIAARYDKWFPTWLDNKGVLLAECVCYTTYIGAAFSKLYLIIGQ
jgi:hypothetical protein